MKHLSKQMPKLTEEDIIAKLRAYADDQCSNKISPEFAYATLVLLEEKDWMIAGLKDDIVIYNTMQKPMIQTKMKRLQTCAGV